MPAVLDEWYELVRATVAHAVARYGLAAVQTWSFEVSPERCSHSDVPLYLSLVIIYTKCTGVASE